MQETIPRLAKLLLRAAPLSLIHPLKDADLCLHGVQHKQSASNLTPGLLRTILLQGWAGGGCPTSKHVRTQQACGLAERRKTIRNATVVVAVTASCSGWRVLDFAQAKGGKQSPAPHSSTCPLKRGNSFHRKDNFAHQRETFRHDEYLVVCTLRGI